MGKIMTYKETAKCPICGLLLEKQEKVIHLGIPTIKAECPDCGYVSYFYSAKADKELKARIKINDLVVKEVKDLFKEYASNLISDMACDAIDRDLYPDVKN